MLKYLAIPLVIFTSFFVFAFKGAPRKSWNFGYFVFVRIIRHFLAFPRTTDTNLLYKHLKKTRESTEEMMKKDQSWVKLEKKNLKFNHGTIDIPRLDLELSRIYLDRKLETVSSIPMEAEWLNFGKSTIDHIEPDEMVILLTHGGAYTMMSPRSHRNTACALSKPTGSLVVSIDYRLAPEDPFPAALFDAVSAVIWLIKKGVKASQIVFQGDSAGGGLAIALCFFLRDYQHQIEPEIGLKHDSLTGFAGILAFSPWLDLRMEAPSVLLNMETDYLVYPTTIHGLNGGWVYSEGLTVMYQLENSKDFEKFKKEMNRVVSQNPYLSPVFSSSFDNLPPLFIMSGSAEMLLSDSIGFFGRAAGKIGVEEYETSTWLHTTTLEVIGWEHKDSYSKQKGKHLPPLKHEKLAEFSGQSRNIRVEIYHDQVHVFMAFTATNRHKEAFKQATGWINALKNKEANNFAPPGLYLAY